METNETGASFGIDLRTHLTKLVEDPSLLHSFRHWFTRALWEAESTMPDDIRALAYRTENVLGVYDAGLWSVDELIAELGATLADWEGLAPNPLGNILADSTVLAGNAQGLRRAVRGKGTSNLTFIRDPWGPGISIERIDDLDAIEDARHVMTVEGNVKLISAG